VNSRVVEFCVVLTSFTNLHDYFGLYSLTGSMSVSMNMFKTYINCYMRYWTDFGVPAGSIVVRFCMLGGTHVIITHTKF